jgi:hypothetical protein
MKTADRISAGVLFGICIYFQVKMDKFNPLSRLFPQVIVIILAGLAFLLFVLSFVRPKETEVFGKDINYLMPVLSVLVMVAWAACIRLIGFLFSSIVFFPLMVVLITSARAKGKRILKNCIVALALIGIFYLLFSLVLGVQFPAGKLGIV